MEHKPLTTTGGYTWEAARHLFRHLLDVVRRRVSGPTPSCPTADVVGDDRTKLRILELGSGTGWLAVNLGLAAIDKRQSLEIVATEQAGPALEHLRNNIQRFFPVDHKGAEADVVVRADELDWALFDCHDNCLTSALRKGFSMEGPGGRSEQAARVQGRFDLVVGSDLVYNEVGSDYLPAVMAKLLEDEEGCTECYYAHTFHRFDHLDERFLARLYEVGLEAREVVVVEGEEGEGAASGEVSITEDFLVELFPAKRIAILRIRRGGRERPTKFLREYVHPVDGVGGGS